MAKKKQQSISLKFPMAFNCAATGIKVTADYLAAFVRDSAGNWYFDQTAEQSPSWTAGRCWLSIRCWKTAASTDDRLGLAAVAKTAAAFIQLALGGTGMAIPYIFQKFLAGRAATLAVRIHEKLLDECVSHNDSHPEPDALWTEYTFQDGSTILVAIGMGAPGDKIQEATN
jgi:hypothetical protein